MVLLFYSKPAKAKKGRSHSATPAKRSAKPGPAARKRSPGAKKKSSEAAATAAKVDILSPAAMTNLYYISHNAMHCLEFRGFGWKQKQKKKKKGKKEKKKGKGRKKYIKGKK